MDRFFETLPADFPLLGGLPAWIACIVIVAAIAAGTVVNNVYFSFLHRRAPGLFRPRVLLAIFVLCIAGIAIGITMNPPSEVLKAYQPQNRPLPSSN